MIIQEPVHIADQMKIIVDRVDLALYSNGILTPAFPHVYFMHGHPLEIVNRLQQQLKNPAKKRNRFPLIALLQDIKIQRNQQVSYYGDAPVHIIICTQTDPHYDAEQRKELVFKPVLYPIYKRLILEINDSGFYNIGLNNIEHDQTDRYFWGKQGLYGNTGNTFDDYIDAIEVENMKLRLEHKQDCKPLSNF